MTHGCQSCYMQKVDESEVSNCHRGSKNTKNGLVDAVVHFTGYDYRADDRRQRYFYMSGSSGTCIDVLDADISTVKRDTCILYQKVLHQWDFRVPATIQICLAGDRKEQIMCSMEIGGFQMNIQELEANAHFKPSDQDFCTKQSGAMHRLMQRGKIFFQGHYVAL